MKIVYLHGFNSAGNTPSSKIESLRKLGEVVTPTYRCDIKAVDVEKQLLRVIEDENPDVIIGCSLGGYWACRLAYKTFLPAVMINPSLTPHKTLKRALGKNINFSTNESYVLTEKVVDSYDDMINYQPSGLVLLDMGDELLDAGNTKKILDDKFRVVSFNGGNHRFAHMEESLEEIKYLVEMTTSRVDND